MDEIDAKILQLLSKNADATTNLLKKEIDLSIPAINKRVKNLKKRGIIKQSTIITDGAKVGKPILAFVMIIIQSLDNVDKLMEYINSNPDILECILREWVWRIFPLLNSNLVILKCKLWEWVW